MAETQAGNSTEAEVPELFRVITRCNSRVRTPYGVTFEYVDNKAGTRLVGGTQYDIDPFGTHVPSWLQFEIECHATDATAAVSTAYQEAHRLACLLSLAANAPVSLPGVYLIYEIRDDDSERFWEQRFHVDRVGLAKRLVDFEDIHALLDGIGGMDAEGAVKVGVALRWYRSAVSTDDLLERFTMVWAGLETLNVLLANRLELERFEESKCPNCGHAIRRPVASGVYGWIEATQGAHIRRQARALRTALAHGSGTIGKAAALVDEIGVHVERSLVEAILAVTGVDIDPPRDALSPDLEFVAALQGTLSGPVEAQIAKSTAHPHVNGELKVKGSHNSGPDGGGVELEYELPGEKVVPAGVTLNVTQIVVPHEGVG